MRYLLARDRFRTMAYSKQRHFTDEAPGIGRMLPGILGVSGHTTGQGIASTLGSQASIRLTASHQVDPGSSEWLISREVVPIIHFWHGRLEPC